MNLYEAGISVLTATPGTANNGRTRTEAVEKPDGGQHAWWRQALCSDAGQRVLAELRISPTEAGDLPEDWQVHPLVEPNDRHPEAALPVTALALRAALRARAGVMFLERRRAHPGREGRPHELHLCAIDPEGTRAALMAVC